MKKESRHKKYLCKVTPLSRTFGVDRGTPIDRHYIEKFLEENESDIKGTVLEILDRNYTVRFGGSKVRYSDVLDINTANKMATIYADLRDRRALPKEKYDCIILPQTVHIIDDYDRVISNVYQMLKKDGVLLCTLPSVAPIDPRVGTSYTYGEKGDFWRFNKASAQYTFRKYFPEDKLKIKSYGNVYINACFLYGYTLEEVVKEELDYYDKYFPLIIGVRAVKDKISLPRVNKNTSPPKASILLYHRVIDIEYDPYALAVSLGKFRGHMKYLKKHYNIISLDKLASGLKQRRVPERSIVITFDDGYFDNYIYARPILESLQIPTTFFVVTSFINTNRVFWWDRLARIFHPKYKLPPTLSVTINNHRHRWKVRTMRQRAGAFVDIYGLFRPLSPQVIGKIIASLEKRIRLKEGEGILYQTMDEKQIQDLARSSLFQVGAHTHHHSMLSQQSLAAQRKEIIQSKQRLEFITGSTVKYFSYPHGTKDTYTTQTVSIIRDCGFEGSCSNFSGVVACDSNLYELPRCTILNWNLTEFKRAIHTFSPYR